MSSDHEGTNVHHTTDPTLLRSIIEEHDGYPAHVPQTEGQGDHGLLRVGFGDADEDLKEISWEKFREEFEEKSLAGVYTDDGSGVQGNRPVVLRKRDDIDTKN